MFVFSFTNTTTVPWTVLHRSAVVGGSSQPAWSGEADETAELFSDSEVGLREAESADIQTDSEDDCDVVKGAEDEEERDETPSPRAFGDSSLKKRPNPFKVSDN